MNQRIWCIALSLLIVLILLPAPGVPANAAPIFPDVPDGASYAEAVRELTARGVLRGYPDGRFGPDDPLLRAQTAVTLVRALGLANDPQGRDFTDQGATDPELWAAIRILAGRDIARGFPDGTFGPADPLTRQQALSFIARSLVALGRWQSQASAAAFSDVAPAHQADIATYLHYVGNIPEAAGSANLGANSLAMRGWYAETLWAALAQPTDSIPRESPSSTPTATRPSPAPPTATPSIMPPSPTTSPHPTFLRGVNLCGAEFGGNILPGVYGTHYTYPTSADLDYYKSKGLTLVRLPVRWERLQRSLYAPLDADEVGRLDAFVVAIRSRNMQVIVEPHNFARYFDVLIGSPAVPNAAFSDFWRRMAEHYRGEAAIWAFALTNEPHDTYGLWPAAAQAGVDGVRVADQSRLILVPGDGWSSAGGWQQNNANLWVTDPANNLMYEAHVYFDADNSGTYKYSYDGENAYSQIGVDRLRPFTEWLRTRNARGFLGEYGVPDNDPRWLAILDTFLTALDDAGLGGTYWAGGPWWGDHPLSVEPRGGQDRPQMPVLQRHLSR